jgi:putative peptidoglycan lipid II flippase
VMLNIVMIGGLLISDFLGWGVGETQSWAMTLSGGVQAVWLAISCARAKASIPITRPRLSQASRRLFRAIGPGAVGAGAAQINLLLTTILASTLPTGAVSYLYYADRLNQLPLGIIGIAVATTLLPILSEHEAHGDSGLVKHYVSRGLEFCLALGLPSAVGLGLAAQPIIHTLFERGAFTAADTLETAKVLSAYSLSIPAFLMVKVLAARFFARHDTKTPVKIALLCMLVNVSTALVLLLPLQHVGMALATSLATWCNAGLLWIALLRRGENLIDDTLRRRAPRLIACAAAMGGMTLFLTSATQPLFETQDLATALVGLTTIIGLSCIVYGVLLQITGAFRLSELKKYRTRNIKA